MVEEAPPSEQLLQAVQAATSLIKAHRTHGHPPRGSTCCSEPEGDLALDLEPLGLTEEIMHQIPSKILRTYVPGATLADALPHLRDTTAARSPTRSSTSPRTASACGCARRSSPRLPRADATTRSRKLLAAAYPGRPARALHAQAYLGQKQFSIEGLDMTVPMLDEPIQLSATAGALREVVLGMAHRGRLNVLAHNLGRAYETIFREFEGACRSRR